MAQRLSEFGAWALMIRFECWMDGSDCTYLILSWMTWLGAQRLIKIQMNFSTTGREAVGCKPTFSLTWNFQQSLNETRGFSKSPPLPPPFIIVPIHLSKCKNEILVHFRNNMYSFIQMKLKIPQISSTMWYSISAKCILIKRSAQVSHLAFPPRTYDFTWRLCCCASGLRDIIRFRSGGISFGPGANARV
jgi:hypothetical protein